MSNASSTTLPLMVIPNPLTPMAWLPPEVAYQKTITAYFLVGALAVLVWDILTHLRDDWNLLARYKINIPTITYFISRWSSLLYTTTAVVFTTAPIGSCKTMATFTCAVYHVAVSSTALLFFFRVRALFNKNKYVTAVFFVMWLGVVGGTLTVIPSRVGSRLGPTKYCSITSFSAYGSAANITIGVFDTCVFLAIQWRILSESQVAIGGDSSMKKKLNIFSSKSLPVFSRALLQDGQKYYMVAMVCNLLVLIWNYIDQIPPACRSIFVVPSVVLTNIMGCRVFRHTKLGHYASEVPPMSTINFRASNKPMSVSLANHRGDTVSSGSTEESGIYGVGLANNIIVLPNSSSEEGAQFSKEGGSAV